MEKIIYNNKIRKFLIGMLIFLLLFNSIFPGLVNATEAAATAFAWEDAPLTLMYDEEANVCGAYVEGSIQAVISSMKDKRRSGGGRLL